MGISITKVLKFNKLNSEREMKNLKTLFIAALVSLLMTGVAFADDYRVSTTGVQGYDLVSYHTGAKPLRGNGNHVAVHQGTTYLFVSKTNQDAFEKNPKKYIPAYNGYCAFGVSVGKKFVGDPDVWRVVDGKLYLNLDTKIQKLWLEDVPGSIKKADNQWKTIAKKAPAEL